ncbi:MAG: DUF6259 domain-containing protein [Nitrospirales bacterium]|nr:DUF6259 domain-containing protein [Nitrospirales bacterium]
MQMVAFFSNSSGLLIHSTDSVGYLSEWEIIPGDKLRIHFYGPESEIKRIEISPQLEAAAESYKQWARQQTWATKKRYNEFSYSLLAVASNPNLLKQFLAIQKLKDAFPPPIGAWITQYRKYEFDSMYPNYEPKNKEEFASFLSKLKRIKCTAFPYINGLLWDARLKSFTLGEAVALRKKNGSLLQYNKKLPWLFYACPGSKMWQNTIIQARKSLVDEEGLISSGVYLDMLLASGPFPCFASNHDHAPGDPLAWQKGISRTLSSIEGMTIGEGNAEIYLNEIDALLMHLFTERDDTVPLWNLVYGDLTASIGWQLPKDSNPIRFSAEVVRSKEFGVVCNGSPWMSQAIQENLLRQEFKSALEDLKKAD